MPNRIIIRVMAVAVTCAAALPTANAQSVNFKGSTVSIVVGSEAGGGTDATARLLAAFFERYLPGQPSVVVRNMPGAQGVTALNYVVLQTKRDGLTAMTGASTNVNPLNFRKANAQFDPTTFQYIGGIGRGGTVMMIRKEAERRLYDKSAQPVHLGAIDGTRASEQVALWGNEYLGWNTKWVVGYRGTNNLIVAFERGEIELINIGSLIHVNRFVNSGDYKILNQSGGMEKGKFVPRPEFGDAPVFAALVESKITDKVGRQAFAYWEAVNATDKWLALPDGTPAAIVAAYRQAFADSIKDADFMERGKKLSEDLAPLSHVDVERLVGQLAATTDETEAFIKDMQRRQGLRVP